MGEEDGPDLGVDSGGEGARAVDNGGGDSGEVEGGSGGKGIMMSTMVLRRVGVMRGGGGVQVLMPLFFFFGFQGLGICC